MKPKEGHETLRSTGGRQGTWIAPYKPDLSVRFYSSSTDAARARRPTDPSIGSSRFYLPPIWGGFAMRWLKRHNYL